MKIDYNNLYTHFIFTTLHRSPLILEKHRERIEKYITGIVNNNQSQLYAIYANPEHVHFLFLVLQKYQKKNLQQLLQQVHNILLMKTSFVILNLLGKIRHLLFLFRNQM
jgi:REP element-mobilizing transposase RayT